MKHDTPPKPLYLLADDIAGAHDVAIPFAKRGLAVAVLSNLERLDQFTLADLIILNTNTRSCCEKESIERVKTACKAIQARSGLIIYKKIDSTLRGNVALELDLVCSMMDCSLAVCAPAFPELGRTTVGGYQLLNGIPIRCTDLLGPDIPPQNALIPDLLRTASGREIVHIDLKTVLEGSSAIRESISRIKAENGATVVVDMAEPRYWNDLLDAILGNFSKSRNIPFPLAQIESTLICGSSGMADAVAERLFSDQHLSPSVIPNTKICKEGPVLIFACSLNDATARQVEELRAQKSPVLCHFDPLLLVNEQHQHDELERVIRCAKQALSEGRNTVLTPKRPNQCNLKEWFESLLQEAEGRDPVSLLIEHLGLVARCLVANFDLGGLVLTGGETAERVFRELESDGGWIIDEIEVGVATMTVVGGPQAGMRVVIKPGSFGDEKTLIKVVDHLLSSSQGNQYRDNRSGGNHKGTGKDKRPVIGITMGDPNGVGPEIIAKILSKEWVFNLCRPLIIGNDEVIRRILPMVKRKTSGNHQDGFSARNFAIHVTDHPESGLYRHGTLDVLNATDFPVEKLVPGRLQPEAGRLAVESVQRAARFAICGDIQALVTAPINKEAMVLAGYSYVGHTELLAELTKTKRYRLSLAFDGILVSHATTHVSLRDAITNLSEEEILVTVELVGRALVGMGLVAPRLAVCGLNPHAGENGLFGDEEIRIIGPAIEKARSQGWHIDGPLPPDTVFIRTRKGDFDGVIGMYHDQGHIPVKAIAFERTVNVTLGLPIIRTSVDHGTAFDIAGRGIANAKNLGEALRVAVGLVGNQWSVGSKLRENIT